MIPYPALFWIVAVVVLGVVALLLLGYLGSKAAAALSEAQAALAEAQAALAEAEKQIEGRQERINTLVHENSILVRTLNRQRDEIAKLLKRGNPRAPRARKRSGL